MNERARNLQLLEKEKRLVPLNPSGDIRLVVAFPNRYWLAMSNLGFQAVYRLFASMPRFHVERVYFPEDGKPEFYSFESHSPLGKAEILALSVSFETDYPYVLAMLEGAGVSLDSCFETEAVRRPSECRRPLILGGGAALTLNPEPLANFFDAIVIGEGEEVIEEIASAYVRWRDSNAEFGDLLRDLSQIEGVYVPSLYRPAYAANGRLEGIESSGGAPPIVTRRFVADIDQYPTHTVIQTSETEFKSMFMTETGRGCEVGCKFCVAGYMYRPVRKRREQTIRHSVQLGLESGESIGFVGAAVSSHPQIAGLVRSVAESGKRAALSSIMSQRVTAELAEGLSECEYKTVALAPEAGSEELRFRVGKRVCDEQIVEAVSTLARNGIRHLKLYFMVGLPSERLEDVAKIPLLVAAVQRAGLDAAREQDSFRFAPTFLLSVNPFIPKAWTPFQRHPFLRSKELKQRLRIVQDGIRVIPNAEMKFESPRESYFQTLLSRGDRRVGDILISLHRSGHDWRWLVQNGEKELVPGVPPADAFVYREIPVDEFLPWGFVDMHIKRELLDREYERTFSFDVKPVIERVRKEFLAKRRASPPLPAQANSFGRDGICSEL